MKYFLLVLIVSGLQFSAYSQTGYIKVIDENKDPVENAIVLFLPDSIVATTNQNGEFQLRPTDSIIIKKLGYKTLVFEYNQIRNDESIVLPFDEIMLSEVNVGGLYLEKKIKNNPGNLELVRRRSINENDPVIITNRLNQVPGVFMQSGAVNTNRITIRGIGARSPFSTNKIRAYLGDIPLTNGTGETTIEDIDLQALGGMEIIKGPNSTLFGSGLGGVILIKPLTSSLKKRLSTNFAVGSFGQTKYGVNGQFAGKSNQTAFSINNYSSDGYRDNNEVNRMNVQLNTSFQFENDKISLLTYFVDQKAFIPSSLGITDFTENPTNAAANWGSAQGFEDYFTWHLGLGWDHAFNENTILKTSLFTSRFENNEARPFNILNEQTNAVGIRSRIIHDLNDKNSLMAGIEYFIDFRDWQTFENLYRDNNGNGSLQGDQLNKLEEERSFINAFAQWEWKPSDKWVLETGINLNSTAYELTDIDTLGEDISGDYNYGMQISPRLGLNYSINDQTFLFASVSNGFSPPSLEETLTPDGDLNTEIEPETGWMQEIGVRYYRRSINASLSVYSMQIQNLLVSRRTAEDQFVGVNAGSTRHNGFETSIFGEIDLLRNISFDYSTAYSFQDYTFNEFITADNDFSGNQLTGVPRNQLISNANLRFYGARIGLRNQFTDQMPITDDNSVYNESYLIWDLSVGYQQSFGSFDLSIDAWLQNFTDEKYASMVQINAGAFGNNEPRYYYPGLPRNFMGRISFGYNF